LIYSVLVSMDLLVREAVKELTSILSLLHPEAREEIERIISVSMKEVNDHMEVDSQIIGKSKNFTAPEMKSCNI